MINIEYLDALYTWKVEAEQELNRIEEEHPEVLPEDEADRIIEIYNINIKHQEGLINRYKIAITSYLFHHNN